MEILHGIGIVFGNTVPQSVQNLTEAALALGASIYTVSEAAKAIYLVANNVLRLPDGSDPYLISIQTNPNIAIVSTDWLVACQAEQRQVPTNAYLLAPFSGIKVSITNFGAKERDVVVQQLKQGSANYSPELFRHATHLVGNRPGGNKYTHAREWGLSIVHHDWVLDCLKAWRRLDERIYNLETYTPRDASTAMTGDYQRQPSRTVSSARGGVSYLSAGAAAGVAGASVPVRQATTSILGVVAPGPTDSVTGGSAKNSSAAVARGGSAVLRHANDLMPSATEDPGAGAQAKGTACAVPNAQPADQYYHIPVVPSDDCYFLHWVRLWVVGCTSSEQAHVLAAVRESGATREPVLHAGVTHILFGSVLSTTDLTEVRQHLSEHREQVKLARLSWLYGCVERRSYMEPEGPYAMTVAQLLLAQGAVGTGQLLPTQSGYIGFRSRESSPAIANTGHAALAVNASVATTMGGSRLDDYVVLDPDGNNRTMDSISVRNVSPGVFTGLWFTLVAVAGTEEESTATKLVRQGGGMILSASTEKIVREPQRRYAVCPFSLPQSAIDRICNNRGRERGLSEASFERVPVEHRVTVAWLRACVSRGELLPVKRETPLFRPLPHALPLPRFQGVMVAVSQYHVEQREVLEQLINQLGGIFTERLNKRCHYLVIQDAQGDKFAHAIKWGIPCVRADWVLESAYAGRPLDDQLIAFLPAGITPVEMEERRAAASRTRGSSGPSQFGPTQRPLPLDSSQHAGTMPARGHQGNSQYHEESRLPLPPSGLPPRHNQPPDRHAVSTQGALRGKAPAQILPSTDLGAPSLSMAPPAAPTVKAISVAATTEDSVATGAKSQAVLTAVNEAIRNGDNEETQADAVLPSLRRGAAGHHVQPNLHRSSSNQPPGGSCAQVPQTASGAAGRTSASSISGTDGSGTGEQAYHKSLEAAHPPRLSDTSNGAAVEPNADLHNPLLQLEPRAEPLKRQADAEKRELDGAAAMLMQFLDNNKFVPEMAFSQLDLPMQLPIPPAPPAAGEISATGAATSSMSSREPGGSLKTTDGDGAGGGVGGRRSRKRAAAATVGEPKGMPGKAGGLPGRRTRNDEEEEGFGVVMSQQVSYEAVAAAPPPRPTRSTTRGRAGGATDAKENLIKAVQGNMR